MGANLQLQGMYGLRGNFWDQYVDQSNRQGQDSLRFHAGKSYGMSPMWDETIRRRKGTFDPRTQGKNFAVQQSHTPEEYLIGSRRGY